MDLKHIIESNQKLLATEHPQIELLRWHHRMENLPFSNINILALLGITPKRLANVKPHKCELCIYRAINKIPWRTKGRKAKPIQMVTSPIQCV